MNLQEKALKHIEDLLSKVEMYPTYSVVSEALAKTCIEQEERMKILNLMSKTYGVEMQRVLEARQWLESMINTTQK